MNPLSPFTYYRRHKRSALLLIVLICLATIGLYIMVGVLDSIPMRGHHSYLTRVSRVYPAVGSALEPTVVSQIRAHPDVARVVLDNGLQISSPALIGTDSLRVVGVSAEDAQYLMARCGVRLKEGRMLNPRTNEIVISEETARALGLQVGDPIERSINDAYYGVVSAPLVVVGILEGDPAAGSGPSVRMGLASYEYLESHELYAPRVDNLLVVAQEGRKEAVDEFLETAVASARTEVETYGEISQFITMGLVVFRVIFGIVNCLVAIVVALVVGVINWIALMERLPELGLLHAVGYPKNRLIGRLTLETVVVAGGGWGAGLVLSWLILTWLKLGFYYDRGLELDLANLVPLWFAVPIPVVVVVFAAGSAIGVFARLDAIAIIERGRLSLEAGSRKRKTRRSSTRSLSSWTFYQRHRRRGILLMASMVLMILGVALPGFLVSFQMNALTPSFGYLGTVSEVSPGAGNAIDPGVAAQVRSHPAVGRVFRAVPLSLSVTIPPVGQTGATIYGVTEDDLAVLMELFDVRLAEGRLPRARSNEIVISRALALNRGLRLGDLVGRPVYELDGNIPTELVVVGTLQSRSGQILASNDLWIGFVSYEYLESHELYSSRPTHLLVFPTKGHKAELDHWLEQDVASTQTYVQTYGLQSRQFRQAMQSIFLACAALEGVIAIVAAISLAILNYIFFTQRHEEFGILYAIGHSRLWLVFRAMRETTSVVSAAWLIGAAVCVAGLLLVQVSLYAPMGLSLDFFDPVPWLFTMPIPLAVVAASVGVVAWMLSRLDPVSIVERRS